MYAAYQEFSKDEVWGVRKASIENTSLLIAQLKPDEVKIMKDCFQFFKKCLSDSNRWVKNQALQQFGPIVHEIFLKIDKTSSVEVKN